MKVPFYEVTEYMDPLGNKYEKPHGKHNVYLHFALPKSMADKFVVFRDSLGYNLVSKGFIPANNSIGADGGQGISYLDKNGKGEIDISLAGGYRPIYCSEAEWFPDPDNLRKCGDLSDYPKPKHIHIDYYNRKRGIVVYTHETPPKYTAIPFSSQFQEVTVILGGPEEIDITLPKKDKAIMNTLIKYYTHR